MTTETTAETTRSGQLGISPAEVFAIRWGSDDEGARMCDGCLTVTTDYERLIREIEGRRQITTLCTFCSGHAGQLGHKRPAVAAGSTRKDARAAFASAVFRMNALRRKGLENSAEYAAAVIDRDQAKAVWQLARAS